MRAASIYNSIMQIPRCRIYTFANLWWGNFDSVRICKDGFSTRLGYTTFCSIGGGHSKKWSRRPITTKTEVGSVGYKPSIRPGIPDGIVITNTNVSINKVENSGLHGVEFCNIQQLIAENKDLDLKSLLTVLVLDIETTGWNNKFGRIIEIALQDLRGGPNSTFQSLINPECDVLNPEIHGITTNMVCRDEIPRMQDLIPIFLRYIESRQKPGGYVMFIAHNGRTFDIPFLIREFARCSHEIPQNWLFLDSMTLAREVVKAKIHGTNPPAKLKLGVLREHYGIPLTGDAHRAMTDVNVLSLIVQRMTHELKIPIGGLVERCFTVADVLNSKKKKSR